MIEAVLLMISGKIPKPFFAPGTSTPLPPGIELMKPGHICDQAEVADLGITELEQKLKEAKEAAYGRYWLTNSRGLKVKQKKEEFPDLNDTFTESNNALFFVDDSLDLSEKKFRGSTSSSSRGRKKGRASTPAVRDTSPHYHLNIPSSIMEGPSKQPRPSKTSRAPRDWVTTTYEHCHTRETQRKPVTRQDFVQERDGGSGNPMRSLQGPAACGGQQVPFPAAAGRGSIERGAR